MNYCMGSAWTSFKLAALISQSSLSIKRTAGGIVQPTVSWNTTTAEMQPMFLWPKDWNSPVVNGKHPEGDCKYILFNHGWKSSGRHRGSSFIQQIISNLQFSIYNEATFWVAWSNAHLHHAYCRHHHEGGHHNSLDQWKMAHHMQKQVQQNLTYSRSTRNWNSLSDDQEYTY